MNTENEFPESAGRPGLPGDDEALGSALGEALGADGDDIILPPPVASIADRAAAKARARNARRAVGSVAASVALIAGGVVGWQALSDDDSGQSEDVAIAAESDDADEPVAESAPAAEEALAEAEDLGLAPEFADIDPTEYNTGPMLEWTAVDGPGNGASLMSLSDGRVMARVWDGNEDRVLVTADGTTWDELSLPAGVLPGYVELGDELWVITAFREEAEGEDVFISDDEGASWTQIELPFAAPVENSYLTTQAFVSGVTSLGDQIVVVTTSYTDVDMARIVIDLGLADSVDQLRGWGYDGDALTVDIGAPLGPDGEPEDGRDPFAVETFTLIPEDLGLPADPEQLFGGPGSDSFNVYLGDADGLELVGEWSGSPSRLTNAGGTLVLSTFIDTGSALLTSTDGRNWSEVPTPNGFEVSGTFEGALWGHSWDELTVLKLVDGQIEEVAAFPGLANGGPGSVGPSGLATTVTTFASFPGDGEAFPTEPGDSEFPTGVLAATDTVELRIDADGIGLLIDLESGDVLRSFTREEMKADAMPAGVTEIESDDETEYQLRIDDPQTGEELVTFRLEDFVDSAPPGALDESEALASTVPAGGFLEYGEGEATSDFVGGPYDEPETWVAWSGNGTDWSFQRLSDAFGLAEDENGWVQVAVGDGFVVAAVEIYPNDDEAFEENGFSPVRRWFVATP